MVTKVGLENNILKINKGTKTIYYNASWCSIAFYELGVTIKDNATNTDNTTNILFTEFQDLVGNSYSTESSIVTYLSDKIG